MADRNVKVTLTANTAPYEQAMGKASVVTGKLDKQATKLTANLGKQAAQWAAAGVAFSVASSQLKEALTAATNLQDSTSKVGVVFGAAAKDVQAFADDTTRSFGLTKTAALDAASTFAIFGKSAGLTGGELTKFATDLTQRAVDLKSFFGGSVEDAITAIGAALRGESEPIRAYGVLLDDATLRARALEMGLVSTTKNALTPQTRALAAAAEVMRQTNDAAGDYIRTQDGAANSIQNFNVAVGRLKEVAGTALLPALTESAQAASGLVNILNNTGLSQALFGVAGFASMVQRDFFGAADSADDLGGAAARAALGVDALGASASATGGSVGTMDEQMRGAIGSLFGFIDAQQALAGSQQDMLGLEAELRESARQTSTTRATGAKKSSDAERKAQQQVVDGIRKRHAAEQEAEIAAARKAAQRKAEARADAGARRDVRGGIAGAIATDKAARRGEDINGFNQGGSVGEATGSLTRSDQAALDKKIDAIRAKHKTALAAQIKGLQQATSTARATAGAVDSYSFSLDANTEAGRRNLATLSGAVDKVQTNAQAVYDAAILEGKGAEQAGRMAQDALLAGYDAIMTSAEGAGFATSEVRKYLATLGLIPKEIKTRLVVEADTTKADAKLKRWGDKVKGIMAADDRAPAPVPLPGPRGPVQGPRLPYPKNPKTEFAGGGEVYGAGSPTSDSVPIWASRGEYVVNASQYAANRELVNAINAGTGRVSGGLQIGSVNVTESTPAGVRRSVIDALAESAYRSGAIR